MDPEKNSYLGEVLEQQQRVGAELQRKARFSAPAFTGGGGASTGRAIDYRVTGWWRWKTVVVPPNVYVVHTRRGHEQPLHIGMGKSFPYNPYTDAFLVIPAAMQTIVISARCICLERQGILVQAYVQWIIDDIQKAYQRLDFSDPEDPMRIVNVQLREQAEAAIKDKVATLGIDEVLADKQPIIEELTHRLRAVAEGSREAGEASGLGLKIVTVQIKEAVVSSTRLWQNLQSPFRAERERLARMAELETARQVAARELEIRHARETSELEVQRDIDRSRAVQAREVYDREQGEAARRAQVEREVEREALADKSATEKARRDAELALALLGHQIARRKADAEATTLLEQRKLDDATAQRELLRTEHAAALEELRSKAQSAVVARELEQLRARRSIDNDLSAEHLRAQLIAAMPEIASKLPAPAELRSITVSGDGAQGPAAPLTALLAGLLSLLEPRIPARASGAQGGPEGPRKIESDGS